MTETNSEEWRVLVNIVCSTSFTETTVIENIATEELAKTLADSLAEELPRASVGAMSVRGVVFRAR